MNDPTVQDHLMTVLDSLQQLIEFAAGYRARLEAMGYSPTVAEQLSAHVLWKMQEQAMGGAR
jgi:hypothetical protein